MTTAKPISANPNLIRHAADDVVVYRVLRGAVDHQNTEDHQARRWRLNSTCNRIGARFRPGPFRWAAKPLLAPSANYTECEAGKQGGGSHQGPAAKARPGLRLSSKMCSARKHAAASLISSSSCHPLLGRRRTARASFIDLSDMDSADLRCRPTRLLGRSFIAFGFYGRCFARAI